MSDPSLPTTRGECEAIDNARRERVLALPGWTLFKMGWEIEPGRVQGGIYHRVGDGIGPLGRDDSTASKLIQAVVGGYDKPWGIEVLAEPVARGAGGTAVE